MIAKRFTKNRLINAVFGCLFGIIGIFGGMMMLVEPAYAVPVEQAEEATVTEPANKVAENVSCDDTLGSLAWLACPGTGAIAKATDFLYEKIESILVINPVEMKDGEPIYEIWKYAKGVANIVFIVFLLVVVYSQLTGMGINNYGIKKILPKLIVAAVLVNLSFIICSLAVDVSNIVGDGVRGIFTSIGEATVGVSGAPESVRFSEIYASIGGGALLTIGAVAVMWGTGTIWMLIATVIGAVAAVAIGLVTIAMRQAVVMLLIMISPLAVVAYMLPNTEKWFKMWKELLARMLVFYPLFSLLFGASALAGWAIIASAKEDGFMVILGVAVQTFPLFFSWSLMKMSGTVLGTINSKLTALASGPLARNRSWAESRRDAARANALANGVMPSAKLMQFMNKRRALLEANTKNSQSIATSKTNLYVQKKIAGSIIGDTTSSRRRTSRYTRNAKMANNYDLMSKNATAHTEHVLNNYGSYFSNNARDKALDKQSARAFVDYGRAAYQKEIDEENDINFLVDKYLEANRRDDDGNIVDNVAFNRYWASVTGPDGDERVLAKVIAQASKVESKQRAEYSIMHAKYGHNGYNKHNFREFAVGYKINDDGWAVDEYGERLKDDKGNLIETVQGDAITKAPEKLVLYNKRDSRGLYYDMKDQDGKVVARIHRGVGDDGINHDNAAFLKETFANLDIPIADPINNVYGILSGIKAGDIVTPQGRNEIGLSRYSTTIGRAMNEYKGNAAWAGAMFNSGIGNRQMKNSAQYALWVCDSIKKTLKPGAFNTQNPASVEYLMAILNPDNWEKIFTEDEIMNAVNINNEELGGEDWTIGEDGKLESYQAVENPTYEQRMNTIKRKYLFPAMKKILPAFDRLRTSNTADNQKPGTADAQYKFLEMVEKKWENNDAIPTQFDPMLVEQDLQLEARAFRQRKYDKDGNLIYVLPSDDQPQPRAGNLIVRLEDVYERSELASDLRHRILEVLNSRDEYSGALNRFDELCRENPDATMEEMHSWFTELDTIDGTHRSIYE